MQLLALLQSEYLPTYLGSYEQSLAHKFRLLGCKEILGFGLMQMFPRLVHKQSLLLEFWTDANVSATGP